MKKISFNFLDWAKKYIKLPSKSEAKNILKEHSKKEILEAYKEVYDIFKTKRSFNLQSLKKQITIAAALFVLLGTSAHAGLPSVENLEAQNKEFFKSIDNKEKLDHVTNDRSLNKKRFLEAMEEIEEVYNKIKSDTEFKDDVLVLKSVLDRYSEAKKNIDNINEKDLLKARVIAERIQMDAYFGYLVGVTKEK